MHPHFAFTAVEILWTLTFACQLVLLVVLLGRERSQRFPWFTASIVITGLHLLAARVLYNRLPQLTLSGIMIALEDLAVLISLLVLVELARKGFRGVKRQALLVATVFMLAIGAAVLKYWGPWPEWKTLTANSRLAILLIMQLFAQKGELFVAVLTIQFGLLMALFGRRYHAGWRTHAQRILIGLSTAVTGQLAVQIIWQIIVLHTKPTSQEQYDRVIGLRDKMSNANSVIYIAVLIWWIACLWQNEPGTPAIEPIPQPPTPPAFPADLPAEAASPTGEPDSAA